LHHIIEARIVCSLHGTLITVLYNCLILVPGCW